MTEERSIGEKPKTASPERGGEPASEAQTQLQAQGETERMEQDLSGERDRLLEENRALAEELQNLKTEYAKRAEKEEALAHLERLAGSKSAPLYRTALQRAEEQEELKHLPYSKRYEMSYYLCLGEQRDHRTGHFKDLPPMFAGSSGNGTLPAGVVKKPVTFEMARENAKKYIGK